MVQGNMDSAALHVELMGAVCKLSGHGALGQKGDMSELGTCGKNWNECLGVHLFSVLPVFEKGMMSVKEQHRGVIAVTGVGISKGWGLRICRVVFELGSREQPNGDVLTFRAFCPSQSRANTSGAVELAAVKAAVAVHW